MSVLIARDVLPDTVSATKVSFGVPSAVAERKKTPISAPSKPLASTMTPRISPLAMSHSPSSRLNVNHCGAPILSTRMSKSTSSVFETTRSKSPFSVSQLKYVPLLSRTSFSALVSKSMDFRAASADAAFRSILWADKDFPQGRSVGRVDDYDRVNLQCR